MWAALAAAAVLTAAPSDAGSLQIKNDRFTYGIFGQERKDTQVIPGDILIVAFDIDGLQTKEDGSVGYSTAMELLNKDGKSVFTEKPTDREATLPLGGNRLPNWSRVATGTDAEAGAYTVRITVVDNVAKGKPQAVLEKKFELLAPRFGIIHVATGYDKPPTSPPPAPPVAVPGQGVLTFFTVVGFQTNPGAKAKDPLQANVVVEMSVLDDAGKPTLVKPFGGEIKEVAEDFKTVLPFNFPLMLNRSGKFTLVITATDKLAKKTAKQELTLTVLDVK